MLVHTLTCHLLCSFVVVWLLSFFFFRLPLDGKKLGAREQKILKYVC